MIKNSIVKTQDEINLNSEIKRGDVKTCFYKCKLRDIKLNMKENNLQEYDECVIKCLDFLDIKDNITNIYYRQAKDYINDSNLYILKQKLNEVRAKVKKYETLNEKYHFEDYRYSTTAELKYEEMKKQEIGSLFGRNK